MKQEPFSATPQVSAHLKPLQASGLGTNGGLDEMNSINTDRQDQKRISSFPATEPFSADFRVPKGVRLSVKPLQGMQIEESSSEFEEKSQDSQGQDKLRKRSKRLLGAGGGTKRDSLKTISESEALSLSKQAGKYIMKKNNNLDLGEYDQFIGEFQKLSSNIFEFGDNSVFKVAPKSNDELINDKLKRSTEKEYEKTEQKLKVKLDCDQISPERVLHEMKKFPPFLADSIPEEDIDKFQQKGALGWTYLTQQIFSENTAIEQKFNQLRKEQEIIKQKKDYKERLTKKTADASQNQLNPQRGHDNHNNNSVDFERTNGNVDQRQDSFFSSFQDQKRVKVSQKIDSTPLKARITDAHMPSGRRHGANSSLKNSSQSIRSSLNRQQSLVQTGSPQGRNKGSFNKNNSVTHNQNNQKQSRTEQGVQPMAIKKQTVNPGPKFRKAPAPHHQRLPSMDMLRQNKILNQNQSTNSGSLSRELAPETKRTNFSPSRNGPAPPSDDLQPPHLIFEQGEILKCFPGVNIKLLILEVFNQKIIDISPYTKSMQNDIIAISTYSVKDSEKANRVKYFNFIINDEEEEEKVKEIDSNADSKARADKLSTVYQYLKRNNFKQSDQSRSHEIFVKVVDRLDARHHIITKQTGLSNSSRYNYEQIQFEAIPAANIHEGEEKERLTQQNLFVSFCVYGRYDMLRRTEKMLQGANVGLKDALKQREKIPHLLLYDRKPNTRGVATRGSLFPKGLNKDMQFPSNFVELPKASQSIGGNKMTKQEQPLGSLDVGNYQRRVNSKEGAISRVNSTNKTIWDQIEHSHSSKTNIAIRQTNGNPQRQHQALPQSFDNIAKVTESQVESDSMNKDLGDAGTMQRLGKGTGIQQNHQVNQQIAGQSHSLNKPQSQIARSRHISKQLNLLPQFRMKSRGMPLDQKDLDYHPNFSGGSVAAPGGGLTIFSQTSQHQPNAGLIRINHGGDWGGRGGLRAKGQHIHSQNQLEQESIGISCVPADRSIQNSPLKNNLSSAPGGGPASLYSSIYRQKPLSKQIQRAAIGKRSQMAQSIRQQEGGHLQQQPTFGVGWAAASTNDSQNGGNPVGGAGATGSEEKERRKSPGLVLPRALNGKVNSRRHQLNDIQKTNILHIEPNSSFPQPKHAYLQGQMHHRNKTEVHNTRVEAFRRSIRIANVKNPPPIVSNKSPHQQQPLLEQSVNTQNLSDISVEHPSSTQQPLFETSQLKQYSVAVGQQGGGGAQKGSELNEQDGRGTKNVKAARQRWFMQQQVIPHHKKNLSYEHFLLNRPVGKRYSNIAFEHPLKSSFDPRTSSFSSQNQHLSMPPAAAAAASSSQKSLQ